MEKRIKLGKQIIAYLEVFNGNISIEEKKPFYSCISLSYYKNKAVDEPTQTMIPTGSNTHVSMNDFVKVGQIFLNKENTIFKKESLEIIVNLNVKTD